jgi:hypothetical protein
MRPWLNVCVGAAAVVGAGSAWAVDDGPVSGYGASLPLGVVVRQIVPATVPVDFADGVDAAVPVSWRGGASWVAALRSAVAPLGVRVEDVGMGIKLVKGVPGDVSANGVAAADGGAVGKAPPRATTSASGAPPPVGSVAAASVLGPVELSSRADGEMVGGVVKPVDLWVAQAGSTLRKTLEAWRQQAGWQKVQWPDDFENADYPLSAESEYRGDIEAAVRGLMLSLGNARQPPSVRLHRVNKVIEVEIPDAY